MSQKKTEQIITKPKQRAVLYLQVILKAYEDDDNIREKAANVTLLFVGTAAQNVIF